MTTRAAQKMHTFRKAAREAGKHYFRDMPWRVPEHEGTFDMYKILVSEIMLQQTQVSRVIPKYESFLSIFPTPKTLAKAPLAQVIIAWNGLGYNRRAKYLHDAVRALGDTKYWTYEKLLEQKGIGANTAAAICVYTRNEHRLFIETNIRSVFLHYFFEDKKNVEDSEILRLLETALQRQDPRTYYWALMDWGAQIKAAHNPNQRSRSYARQTPFKGSLRQLRGQIIRELARQSLTKKELDVRIHDARLTRTLSTLASEGLIQYHHPRYQLPA